MTLHHGYRWQYTDRGRVKHAVYDDLVARCGAVAVYELDTWRGTGSQDEYDRLEQLPECQRCRKILGLDLTPRCRICRASVPNGKRSSFASNICADCVSDSEE